MGKYVFYCMNIMFNDLLIFKIELKYCIIINVFIFNLLNMYIIIIKNLYMNYCFLLCIKLVRYI